MSLNSQIQTLDELMASMPALPLQVKLRSKRRQLISSLYPRIQDLLNKNYGHERVCELIRSETGIEFKVETLKKYLYEERLQRGGKPYPKGTRRRSRSPKPRNKAPLHTASIPQQEDSRQPETLTAAQPIAVTATSSQVQTTQTEAKPLKESEFNTILRS